MNLGAIEGDLVQFEPPAFPGCPQHANGRLAVWSAVELEHVAAFNYDACPGRYDRIASLLQPWGGKGKKGGKENLVHALSKFRESLGVTERLSDLGVKNDDFPELAKKAICDPCLATNPRKMTIEDIITIYERAL